MKVGEGEFKFEWIENWARIPDTESARTNGRTHGVVALDGGDVMIFSQSQPAVLRFDAEGRLKNAWGDRFIGAHGMTLVRDGDTHMLWLTDQTSAEIVKTTLDGRSVLSLQRPDIPAYRGSARFVPTWVAVNEERFGGNGDVWVADGYGANYVHHYSNSGAYIGSINGTEGKAGAFSCPHGIAFIPKPGGPELYIADRSNRRIQVYDAAGKFKRAFGQEFLTSPCGFAVRNGIVYVPELKARLSILDERDQFITCIGENDANCNSSGWPNLPSAQISPGKFNSPHAAAVDSNGNLYLGEWILGGRIIKLAKI